jgi:hypothetical protein
MQWNLKFLKVSYGWTLPQKFGKIWKKDSIKVISSESHTSKNKSKLLNKVMILSLLTLLRRRSFDRNWIFLGPFLIVLILQCYCNHKKQIGIVIRLYIFSRVLMNNILQLGHKSCWWIPFQILEMYIYSLVQQERQFITSFDESKVLVVADNNNGYCNSNPSRGGLRW